MLQERRNFVFDGFTYVFHMINKGQIYTGIISKETQLNIILSNALHLSLSFLARLSFKNLKTSTSVQPYLYPTSTNLKCE